LQLKAAGSLSEPRSYLEWFLRRERETADPKMR
jgi:hypothetical protein